MRGGAVGHGQGVVERGHDDVMANEATVSNPDTALVLEAATGVDEHVLTEVDIGSEVCGERRRWQ